MPRYPSPKNTANVKASTSGRSGAATAEAARASTAARVAASAAGRGGGARTPIQAPAVTPDTFSDNYGGSGMGDVTAAYSADTNPYYTAQAAALKAALQNYEADYAANKANYALDYGEGLRKLGWSWTKSPSEAMLDTMVYDQPSARWMTGTGTDATPVDVAGQFSQEDVNTASGRAYASQLGDFAARGMLRSSEFYKAKEALDRSLLDQAGAMQNARQRYLDDLRRQRDTFISENAAANEAARLSATNQYTNLAYGG